MSIFFRNTKAFGLIATTVLASASTFLFFNQLPPNVALAQNQTELTLDVTSPKRNHLPLEPIVLKTRLSNRSASPLTWSGSAKVGSRDLNIVTRLSNGIEYRWIGDRGNNSGFPGPDISQPNASKDSESLIDGHVFTKIFPHPGRYLMTVEFLYDDFSSGQRERHRIVSNSIPIDITSPSGPDLLAYEYLRNVLRPVLEEGKASDKLLQRQYFAAQFGNTSYAKFNAYELGKLYLNVGQYQNAENEFYKISDIDFFYARQVDRELDNLAIKLKRPYTRTKRPPVRGSPPVPQPIPSPNISAIPIAPIPPPIAIPISTPIVSPTPILSSTPIVSSTP